jgi:hypothetical protein
MLDTSQIDKKAADLIRIANTLKQEFFGLDDIIDQVIVSINAWYTFPQLIQRPVIINLWGLTGVGKTQLVRRLSHLLGFSDRFIEVQMDGITSANANSNFPTTISRVLVESSIEEGKQGILLLDEFQRYRTIDNNKQDVKIERFQDVWMLLSDGMFMSDSSLFKDLEEMLAYAVYNEEMRERAAAEPVPNGEKPPEKKKHMLYPYEAVKFKKLLKLSEPVQDIMQMAPTRLLEMVSRMANDRIAAQRDYTKLLIFISGNLDEAFHPEDSNDDCDTDADVFHERTKKITIFHIKRALAKRFKSEQIARFGNNHVIYPSLSKEAYQKLIHASCAKYMTAMQGVTGIEFRLDDASKQVIYQNSVYPVQGTRPVFSSVHKIFSDGLVQMAFWAIKRGLTSVDLTIDDKRSMLVGVDANPQSLDPDINEVLVSLDVDIQRKKAGPDFKTLVAVHEAGHALVHALLFLKAPQEVKINASSYAGGYIVPSSDAAHHIQSRVDVLNQLAMLLAGRSAELLVFGPNNVTIGAASDLEKATVTASEYVREQGMDGLLGVEKSENPGHTPNGLLPDRSSNVTIDTMLHEQSARATQLLSDNKVLFVRLVERLLAGDTLSAEQFAELLPELPLKETHHTYTSGWKLFAGT